MINQGWHYFPLLSKADFLPFGPTGILSTIDQKYVSIHSWFKKAYEIHRIYNKTDSMIFAITYHDKEIRL